MKGLIFTYLLTYGGAAIALFNPFYALLVYLAFGILRPEALWFWCVPPGNYSRIVAIALLVGWAVHGFGKWNFHSSKPIVMRSWVMGVLVFGALFAGDRDRAWEFVEGQWKTILPVFVGMTLIDSVAKLKMACWTVLVCQAYVALQFNLTYWGGGFRASEFGFGGLDNNGLSVVQATGVGLALFLGLTDDVWWRKGLGLIAALLMAHVPMFCMSRGGMLGLCVVGLVSFVLIPKRPINYLVFAGVVAMALRLAGPMVVERFNTSFTAEEENRESSAQSRLDLWSAGWQVMKAYPLTGLGPNQWRLHAHEYGFTPGKAMHSTWVSTGTELGFPGLICLASFYLITIARSWRIMRWPAVDPWLANMARMTIAALTGFIVSGAFVAIEGAELPYYVVLLGAVAIKLADEERLRPQPIAASGGKMSSQFLATLNPT